MARVAAPRRGSVYWVSLDPTVGSEIKKTRPAVVVSNDAMNRYGSRVVVLPVTSNVDHCFPGEVLVRIKGKVGRALGDQVRSIDKVRIGAKIANLERAEVDAINEALAITLALP